jgi:signal transduction histidine kinase
MVAGKGDKKSTPRQNISVVKKTADSVKSIPPRTEKLARELERVKKANSRLRRMEKLRVDLTHMIIHDLKGPLAEIIANLSLLEDEALSRLQEEYLSSAILGAEELFRRVQNILEVYRLETKKKMIRRSLFDPLETVQSVVKGLGMLTSMREISIRVNFTDGSHPLFADKDLFARIVLNLLINAVEHSPSWSEIDVDLSWSQDRKRLQVAVSDRGSGIKEIDRKRLFRKFSTTRHGRVPGHMGLGLPFCKFAVEAHGGKIWVEDRDGPGSSFHFTIPRQSLGVLGYKEVWPV